MKTITFYSYKGGVGRSLALANIAIRLSEFNKKVCLIDFDLEAPGLPHKFSKYIKMPISKGIVDYIYEFTNKGLLENSIGGFSIPFKSAFSQTPIHLIPAGNPDHKDYWKKLSSINWFDLIYESGNGLAFFLDLKQKIKNELKPDFLLIDSRTGVSEMSGITLSLLADEVVIVAANNTENITGAKKIIQSLQNSENSILGLQPKITFVLSRIPFTDRPEDKVKELTLINKVKRSMSNLVSDINIIHSDRDLEETEQIKIGYEKDDTTAQISRDYLNLFEKITQNVLTSEEVQKFEEIKQSERWYQKSVSVEAIAQKIDFIDKAIALNDKNPDFFQYRGILNQVSRKYDQALSDFFLALNLSPNRVYIYELIGRIYIAQENFTEAETMFNEIIKIGQDDSSAYTGLGSAQNHLGKYDLAIDSFSKAINLNPDSALAYNNRGNSFRLKGDFSQALNDVYKALEIDPDLSIAYSTLAEINAQLNNYNEFYLNFEKFVRNYVDIDEQALVKIILSDNVYKKFLTEERFTKLLEKYNIVLE